MGKTENCICDLEYFRTYYCSVHPLVSQADIDEELRNTEKIRKMVEETE